MVVSALYLLAGCAFFGGALQTQQSVAASGRRSVVHALLAGMWWVLGLLALANSIFISHSGSDGLLSYETLIRYTLIGQFLLWFLLIWLVVTLTHVQLTLIPTVLSGVWLFLLIVSIRIPLELFIANLPQHSSATVPGATNNWWLNIYIVILATFIYCQFACYQLYMSGYRNLSRIIAGGLILLLETSIYDFMVTINLIHSPTITVFGFLGLLLLISFYFLPSKTQAVEATTEGLDNNDLLAHQGNIRTENIYNQDPELKPVLLEERLKSISKTLMAIDLYAGMGLRRVKRGANEPEKLDALFRKVQSEASNGREISDHLTGKEIGHPG